MYTPVLHILLLRKQIGHTFKSMRLSDVDPATCNNRISVLASGKLTSSLEVQPNSALNVLLPLVPLRLGFHWDHRVGQSRQLRSKLLKRGLQRGQL